MLCSEPGIEDDFTNAFPFKIKESCLIYLNNMKGKETQDIEIGCGQTKSNSTEEWIRDYGVVNYGITPNCAKMFIQKGNWVHKIKEKLIMNLLINPSIVRIKHMP